MATLESLFPKFTSPSAPEVDDSSASETANKTISVVMLGGDSTVVPYSPLMTIQELKTYVQTKLGPAPEKQRLLFKEQELKVGKCQAISLENDHYNMQTADNVQSTQ